MLLLASLSGCTVEEAASEPTAAERVPRVRLVPVSGRVTRQGKPLAGAVVAFLPESSERGILANGETGPDGRYFLSVMDDPGAAPGDYRVMISRLVAPDGTVVSLADRSSPAKSEAFNRSKEQIPADYSHPSRSSLHATVRPQVGNEFDFDIPE